MAMATTFPPLEAVTAPVLATAPAAHYLSRAPQTLRAWASSEAGPIRPIRINGQLSDWENTLFIDAGAVSNQPSELTPKVGVGFGARWKSPVGPLQIDLAYGVDVKRLRLHMNLGFSF